ncbi:MAG: hypothetical protein IH602_00770, partial [Bryobacteraceae bacterium]|nr:hypothetical protein [Bryobacteraceae bacterium]
MAVVWASFGPYHYARLRALNEVFDVTAIQLTDREDGRGWGETGAPIGVRVRTLLGESVEGRSERGVAGAVWRALDEWRPDAVLVPGYSGLAVLAMAVWAKWRRVPAVMMNESTREDRSRSGWKEWAKRQLVKNLFRCAVVGGVRSAEYAVALGIPRAHLGYCHNVVDNRHFAEGCERIRERAARAKLRGKYLLYVGRLSAEKNLDRLIEAYARFSKAGGNWGLK